MSPEPSEGGQSTSQRALARAATTKAWLEVASGKEWDKPAAETAVETMGLHGLPLFC